MLNAANGRIAYRLHARDLHLVMGPAAQEASVRFRVLIDGQPPGAAHALDDVLQTLPRISGISSRCSRA